MLGAGIWHRKVPKDHIGNLKFRRDILKRAAKDRAFQEGIMEICRQDIRFWINTFVYQYNVKHVGHELGPFITYDFQDIILLGGILRGERVYGILECVTDQKDLRWQKSREIGGSWLVLLAINWLCTFHTHKDALIISRDEKSVDSPGNPNSLFAKIIFVNKHCPDWMTAGIARRSLDIQYTRTDSTVTGEASTPKAGVGGRASIALIDEFGQFDGSKGVEVFSRTADTCTSRIFVFTHKDTSSMAYSLCFDEKYSGMREIITHWSQHPEKNRGLYFYDKQTGQVDILDKTYKYPEGFEFVMDGMPDGGPLPGLRSPWYDAECIRRPARAVAMDLDINPRGASTQFYDAYMIATLKTKYTTDPLWTGSLKYDKATGEPLELVHDPKGLLKLWLMPISATEVAVATYGAGADISQGTGASRTCLSVVNANTGEKVCEYGDANLNPIDAAYLFTAICRLFKDKGGIGAKLAWEVQGPGQLFGLKVVSLKYNNIYIQWKDADVLIGAYSKKIVPGWNPSSKQKMVLHSDYCQALKERRFLNRSRDALNETLNFVYTSTGAGIEYRYRGMVDADNVLTAELHHGDMVVADALAWKMVKDCQQASPDRKVSTDWNDPRTLEGRMKNIEQARREQLIWL